MLWQNEYIRLPRGIITVLKREKLKKSAYVSQCFDVVMSLGIDKSRIKRKVWFGKNFFYEADFSDDKSYKPYFSIFYILKGRSI